MMDPDRQIEFQGRLQALLDEYGLMMQPIINVIEIPKAEEIPLESKEAVPAEESKEVAPPETLPEPEPELE